MSYDKEVPRADAFVRSPARIPLLSTAVMVLLHCLYGGVLAAEPLMQWQHGYACARPHADNAYRAAGHHLLNPRAPLSHVQAPLDSALACIDSLLPKSALSQAPKEITGLRSNLTQLDSLIARVDPLPPADPDWTRIDPGMTGSILNDSEITTRPIALATIGGTLNVSRLFAEWLADGFQAEMQRTRRQIWTGQQLLTRRSDYAILFDEYRFLRAELDRLASFDTGGDADSRQSFRAGLSISGYEGSVLGAGAVRRLTQVLGRDLLIAPSALAAHGDGWEFGGEFAAGVVVSDIALMPGLLFMQGQKPALSGSVILVRPGDLMMGISFSTVQGVGVKMIVEM
jgi:hypothetical protein